MVLGTKMWFQYCSGWSKHHSEKQDWFRDREHDCGSESKNETVVDGGNQACCSKHWFFLGREHDSGSGSRTENVG